VEEKQYDSKMRIKLTKKNKINICILFFYIFFNSIFYIIPYYSLYFNYKERQEKDINKNKGEMIAFIGIIICSTHIGILMSRLIYACFSKFKKAYIFYCISFMFSLLFILSSLFIKLNNITINIYIHVIIYSISRLFLGLSNERIITRKYLLLFIPESRMKNFSVLFLITSYIGFIAGACLNFCVDLFPEDPITIKTYDLDKDCFIYIIGTIISFILLLVILILFTEPNIDDEANMLTQQILTMSQVTDDCDTEEEKKKYEKK
jgi:hypothetical protein